MTKTLILIDVELKDNEKLFVNYGDAKIGYLVALPFKELTVPTEEEIEQIIDELAKETTAPDKDTPDWMRADIRRGINAIIKLLNQ